MKIVFDEAGNTGCLLTYNDVLNFRTQPVFSLGAVIVRNVADEAEMIKRYSAFLDRHALNYELKGSDLMKRENNALLFDFVENVLDDTHFKINLYDKRFYLSSLLCTSILGHEFQLQNVNEFYSDVSALAFESDNFFISYLKFVQNINTVSLHNYLTFLRDYKYMYLNKANAGLLMMANKILEENGEEHWVDDFMTFGWYDDKRKTNVVNLVALGELIDTLKREDQSLRNRDIIYIHDRSKEFEALISNELSGLDISVQFKDSKDDILIQIADNAVSVLQKIFIETKRIFAAKNEWLPESEWLLTLASTVLRKLTISNIKFTIPIPDWAMMLCVRDMFAPEYPKYRRKNIYFNPLYCKWQMLIADNEIELVQSVAQKDDPFGDMRR